MDHSLDTKFQDSSLTARAGTGLTIYEIPALDIGSLDTSHVKSALAKIIITDIIQGLLDGMNFCVHINALSILSKASLEGITSLAVVAHADNIITQD